MPLSLTRKKGEALIINNDTEIRVTEISSSEVRLDISAPHDVIVDREEVHKIKQSKLRGK